MAVVAQEEQNFLAIYAGATQKNKKDSRCLTLPTHAGFQLKAPLMFELCWYQSAINEINDLLVAKWGDSQRVIGTKRSAAEAYLPDDPAVGGSSPEESEGTASQPLVAGDKTSQRIICTLHSNSLHVFISKRPAFTRTQRVPSTSPGNISKSFPAMLPPALGALASPCSYSFTWTR